MPASTADASSAIRSSDPGSRGERARDHHRQTVTAPGAPRGRRALQPRRAHGGLLFCSGQMPLDPTTGELVGDDARASRRASACRTCEAVCAAGGRDAGRRGAHRRSTSPTWATFAEVNEAYAEFFAEADPPARSTIGVAALPLGRAGRDRRRRRAAGLSGRRPRTVTAEDVARRAAAVARRRAPHAGAAVGDAVRALRRRRRAQGREPAAHRLVQDPRRAEQARRARRRVRAAASSPAARATTRRRSPSRRAARGVPCEVLHAARGADRQGRGRRRARARVVHAAARGRRLRRRGARARAEEAGMAFVHPFDDPDVVAGQGTLGLELLEDVADLAHGRRAGRRRRAGVSGVAIAVKSARPGVSRSSACRSRRARRSPRRCGAGGRSTVDAGADDRRRHRGQAPGRADAARSSREWVDDVVARGGGRGRRGDGAAAREGQARRRGRGRGRRRGAARRRRSPPRRAARPSSCCQRRQRRRRACSRRSPAATRPRRAAGSCSSPASPDRPGALARLLALVGGTGANLVEVEHVREGVDLHVRETAVQLVLETRGPEHAEAVLEAIAAAGYDATGGAVARRQAMLRPAEPSCSAASATRAAMRGLRLARPTRAGRRRACRPGRRRRAGRRRSGRTCGRRPRA